MPEILGFTTLADCSGRILTACRERNVPGATHGIARHQARIAITVMTHAVPEREPATIRAALQLVLGAGFEPDHH